MKIKALKSFCGAFSMGAGEIRICNDQRLIADLLRAGYVEIIKEPKPDPKPEPAKAAKPEPPAEKKPAKKRSTRKAG